MEFDSIAFGIRRQDFFGCRQPTASMLADEETLLSPGGVVEFTNSAAVSGRRAGDCAESSLGVRSGLWRKGGSNCGCPVDQTPDASDAVRAAPKLGAGSQSRASMANAPATTTAAWPLPDRVKLSSSQIRGDPSSRPLKLQNRPFRVNPQSKPRRAPERIEKS